MTIGMFDSGLGGLTVMKEVIKKCSGKNVIYFGDTARVPYGEKSPKTIRRYSLKNSHFLIDKTIDLLVVACNTASAHALDDIRALTKIPVIGVIEPGVKQAIQMTKTQRLAVLATRGTINSGVYQTEIKKWLPDAYVKMVACPLFVPLVEENFISHAATKLIIKEYLKSIQDDNIDTILLGCTHYPVLQSLIQKEVGDTVTLVNSASSLAQEVFELCPEIHTKQGQHHFYVSDDPEKFKKTATFFLGQQPEKVELVCPGQLEILEV